MLNPVHLRTLTAVVATGSFADAARMLGYTGSAVSQQISALERAVKMTLFEREAHSVRPTPAATFLADKAGESLAALEDLEAAVRSMAEGYSGTVRLGSFSTASSNLVPYAMNVVRRERPDVEVMLDENEPDLLVPSILNGALDVALIYQYSQVPQTWPRSVKRVALLREELFLLVPDGHRLAAGAADDDTVALADLENEVWVGTSDNTLAAANLRRLCAAEGFVPRLSARTNDYRVLTYFVRRELGIALVPAMGHDPMEGVTRLRLRESPASRTTGAAFREPKGNPAVPALVDGLRAAACELVRQYPESGLTVL